MKKTLQKLFSSRRCKSSALWLLGPALCLLAGQQAQAQTTTFPRQVPFTTNSSSGFTLGGTATLTGTSSTSTDGVLQLTTAAINVAGFAIDQSSFPAPDGFSISFEFFAYGGTGADGFSVFLIDADKTSAAAFTSGATGGSLGYAQKSVNNSTDSPGVPNGYIGIGIDEFGNFANPTEGRVGGPGPRPDAVSIRGSGLGQDTASISDYPYLAGSGTLPFSLDVTSSTRVISPSDANYRRAYIDVVPQSDGTYKIMVRIQHGLEIYTAINNITVPKPPANLRIGFSGSTGGATNYHEIRNLAILQKPIANDDKASVAYSNSTGVSLNVISNDVFSYSNYKPGTVDLDPFTDGIQNTYFVAGKGTFSIADDSILTFKPSGTYAGVVTIPYTVQDLAGASASPAYSSNPANIIITVTGADVASSVSGPTTANPGSQVTYTVNTSNIGVETATNVIPTLTLPGKPATSSLVLPSGATYDAATGIVKFAQTTLAANASVSNSVKFTIPTTGTTSVVVTSGYTYPSGAVVPDPISTNNTATLTTTVSGLANASTSCATPGKDGPGTLDASSQPNTYYPGTASVSVGATSITLGAAVGSTPIGVGDLLLIMQMQGADIDTSNSTAYGSGGTSASGNLTSDFTAGQYEYALATNAVDASGGTLTIKSGLTNAYQQQDYSASVTGQRRFQVIRVPQYSSLALSGTVTGAAWNGTTGGVLVFDVAGKTTFNTSASLDMSGKGFRGGGGKQYLGNTTYTNTDYRNNSTTSTSGAHGSKGEGTAGTPAYVNNAYSELVSTGVEGYQNGSVGAGAPGNAGGGGTDYAASTNNQGNTGGAGGGNGGSGGLGGYGSKASGISLQASGGSAFSSSTGRLLLGGGGGAGSNDNADGSTPTTANTALVSSGAAGGGIIILRSGSFEGPGTVVANGATALSTVGRDSPGGGGAGGTVVLFAGTTSTLSTLTIQANGGIGGSAVTDTIRRGPGGGGGGGIIYTNGTVATTSVTGGANGTTPQTNSVAYGATAGSVGVISTSTSATVAGTISANSNCMPMLTAALSTSTPNVTRSGSTVNPATYTLTVSNTGGAASSVGATITMDNSGTNGGASGLFTYKSGNTVVQITTANGTSTTLTANTDYTLTTATNGAPTFSGISLPAGATLTVTYQAAIAASAVTGKAYQSGARISYIDPTRTATTAQVSPADTYSGGGTVPGSNYTAASSTNDDVIIVQPLPVELTRFEVAAAGSDAQLSWTTASEKNNAYFEVQRSLMGEVFETIGKRTGRGSVLVKTDYAYTDAGAARLTTHPIYYRLRQVDYDGQESFSPVRAVTFAKTPQLAVALYPNPAHHTATLDLTGLPAGAAYQVQLLDLTGRVLRQQSLVGGEQHTLPVQQLPQGSYLVRINGGTVHLNLKLVRD